MLQDGFTETSIKQPGSGVSDLCAEQLTPRLVLLRSLFSQIAIALGDSYGRHGEASLRAEQVAAARMGPRSRTALGRRVRPERRGETRARAGRHISGPPVRHYQIAQISPLSYWIVIKG
jgi:hypothetical protein